LLNRPRRGLASADFGIGYRTEEILSVAAGIAEKEGNQLIFTSA